MNIRSHCILVAGLLSAAAVWNAGPWVGGSETAPTPQPVAATRSPHAATPARQAAPGRAALLLSPFGPMPTDSAPAPTITPAEAKQLEDDHDGDVVHIKAGCCGDGSIETARGLVHGLIAALNLPPDAPVLIGDAASPLAAPLAVQLLRDGLTRVFFVARPDASHV